MKETENQTPSPSELKLGDTLSKRPIREIEIEVSETYAVACINYLKGLGVSMEYLRDGFYLVRFPEGAVEEQRFGKSGHYTQRTYIVLPSGVEFSKIISLPLNGKQVVRTTMAFPADIFP